MEKSDNLETLHNKREYEHHRKATPEYIELLLKTVEQLPADLGYEFGRWTAERLATYLTEQTGIDLSSSQGAASYIWAKYDLESKQDPIERASFQERLSRYLAVARDYPEHLQVWFWERTFGKEDSFKRAFRREASLRKRRARNVASMRAVLVYV